MNFIISFEGKYTYIKKDGKRKEYIYGDLFSKERYINEKRSGKGKE